ncbi:hypothetical protein CTI12_AA552230 [Artemisia annua]|uniref:Uncharacterized protein n=1 Tax=Artemisia annua TaxID=35608 RepID=A0A2U1KYC0_ARTAN|nr:hypothetical protein CTI12_AA552230 [Artemisia annua]
MVPYSTKPYSNTPTSSLPTSNLTPPSVSTDKPHHNPAPITLQTPPKPLPFTKLSPEALQQRRKDGLCFRCPEKFVPGHKCSPPQFLIIVDNDDHRSMPDPSDTVPPEETPTPQLWSLSAAAYFGVDIKHKTTRKSVYVVCSLNLGEVVNAFSMILTFCVLTKAVACKNPFKLPLETGIKGCM